MSLHVDVIWTPDHHPRSRYKKGRTTSRVFLGKERWTTVSRVVVETDDGTSLRSIEVTFRDPTTIYVSPRSDGPLPL